MNQTGPYTIFENLKPTALCDFDAAPEIKTVALEVVAEYSFTYQKTACIRDFIKSLPYRYDDWDVKASDTLKRGWGMCSGRTNLLVAMLRSLNIPARYCILKCQAELELFQWLIDQDAELERILGEPYAEVYHINAEVFLDNRWQAVDPLRDPALEAGMSTLGIPVEMQVINRSSITSFDEWAVSRQSSIRIKEGRQTMLKLMNDQLEKLRMVSNNKQDFLLPI
jgi:transglutaminase-like putative cysteine protease